MTFLFHSSVRNVNLTQDKDKLKSDASEKERKQSIEEPNKQILDDIRTTRRIGNLPPIYPNGWFVILESSDVGENQVKYVAALGQKFAVYRTAEGKIKVVDAHSSHLGAGVDEDGNVIADSGSSFDDVEKCPKVTGKPSIDAYPENMVKRVQHSSRSRTWRSCEVNHLIFVWYHADGDDPTWEIEPVEQITNGGWCYAGRFENTVFCHIQDVMENIADSNHFHYLHSSGGFPDADNKKSVGTNFVQSQFFVHWQTNSKEPHKATTNMRAKSWFFNKFKIPVFQSIFVHEGPGYIGGTAKLLGIPISICIFATPIEPLVNKVVTRFYCPPDSLSVAITRFLQIPLSSSTMAQDMPIWNNKMHVDKPILVKEDEKILHFRRWFNNFYTPNSPRYELQKNVIDW